jgi:hypothetical protein
MAEWNALKDQCNQIDSEKRLKDEKRAQAFFESEVGKRLLNLTKQTIIKRAESSKKYFEDCFVKQGMFPVSFSECLTGEIVGKEPDEKFPSGVNDGDILVNVLKTVTPEESHLLKWDAVKPYNTGLYQDNPVFGISASCFTFDMDKLNERHLAYRKEKDILVKQELSRAREILLQDLKEKTSQSGLERIFEAFKRLYLSSNGTWQRWTHDEAIATKKVMLSKEIEEYPLPQNELHEMVGFLSRETGLRIFLEPRFEDHQHSLQAAVSYENIVPND